MNENNPQKGHIHPLTRTIDDIVNAMVELGFEVAVDREMEDEFHNFDALNIPQDHPARDMQDTFWLKGSEKLLRTHTSSVQIRYMENNNPPIKIVAPGKVYRNEATDKTHETQFHQVEGLVVGKDITMGHLKFTLLHVLRKLFGDDLEIRLRPSFFSFTEPSVEVDMRKKGTDKWIEVLGAGLVNPHVLNKAGINPREYTGFAFGIGADRIAMMKYGIDDVRLLYNADLRLVNQF